MNEEMAKRMHADAGNSVSAWQHTATELLGAADLILRTGDSAYPDSLEHRLGPVELMLRGMAVECLLKSYWLARGGVLVENGEYLGIPHARKHHDLGQLADATGFKVDVQERDLLQRLSEFSRYGGRYPIPTKAKALMLQPRASGGESASLTWCTPSDYQLLDDLISRIRASAVGGDVRQ